MEKPKRQKSKGSRPISWKEIACKIIIAAMNKGQLPVLSLACILFLICYRMPEEDLGKIILLILEKCVDLSLFGYFLAFLFLISCILYIKKIKKNHQKECERIGKEKTELQNELQKIKGKEKFKSSEE